ncbi:MAG: (Na+)-NQR maturation NqrM [SAR86 cluster bacterium]|uniref:(Na+)-NQR maturation NqrM n=1 Tax=SAR86 cluster bacterium TaxID=2030880 RepID=A0A520MHI3_9GAMM|nr:MAG: (Na+)-NQR maturation NqrM [SAR86 cluster bacterium]|tara:strand:- start:181 stop:357 length:177 start_codon:yes stop_codon:yes gene_type:complete
MSTFISAFIIISLAFLGLAIGLILKNQPIKGSCGGMANLDEGSECQICGRTDPQSCSK